MKKEKFSIEFILGNASQKSLWRMLTEPAAIEQWFADEVKMENDILFTFIWGDNTQEVEQAVKRPIKQVRYAWLASDREGTYFEFKIHSLELSDEIALEVIDFATPEEKEDAVFLWENQVDQLKRKLGI